MTEGEGVSFLTKWFLRGLGAVLPIAVTIYILYWLGTSAEAVLGGLFRFVEDKLRPGQESVYVPGTGVATGLVLVFVIGILTNLWLTRLFLSWGERLLEKIPLVKTLYGSVRDMMQLFGTDEKKSAMKQTVAVEIGGGPRLVGFVTREDLEGLPDGMAREGDVAVYLPMSYQVGGFTVFVSRDSVTPLEMSIQDGMRFAVTAGVSSSSSSSRPTKRAGEQPARE